MVRKSREQLLAELRRKKTNRTLEEAEALLTAFGFDCRPGSKERGGVWSRGMFTLTLPKPHRGDRTLSPKYIGRIVQMVDLVEAYEEAESEED